MSAGPLTDLFNVTVTQSAANSPVFDVTVQYLSGNDNVTNFSLQPYSGTFGTSTPVTLSGAAVNLVTNPGWSSFLQSDYSNVANSQAGYFNIPTGTNLGAPPDSTIFYGTFTEATPGSLGVGSQIQVNLYDNGVGTGTISLTPESSAWLLLLAAIAPLGLLAWRRRSAFSRMT
jgi:hypothetical protein